MTERSDACGVFGKMPQQGDFISHGLHQDLVDRWYSWCRAGLSISREQLGDEWFDCYLTSPVWRFALSPGLLCRCPVVGLFIPSVDDVGRPFPLLVAHTVDSWPWEAYLAGDGWFDKLERVARSALDESTDLQSLSEAVEALPVPGFERLPRYRTDSATDTGLPGYVLGEPGVPARPSHALGLLHLASTRLSGGYGLWWSDGSDHVAPALVTSTGMPAPEGFAALLDGRWSQWGWPTAQPVTEAENSEPKDT